MRDTAAVRQSHNATEYGWIYPAVLLCFALSGFAALLYETAWTREFAFVFGTSHLSVATVLAAYMGGLALGAALAARWAARITRPVLTYGLLELGIAVGALMVPFAIAASINLSVTLFGGAAAPPDAGGGALTVFQLACAFIILVLPTTMMGATLPLLARFAVRSADELGTRVGTLYATNTLGAVCGTLVAGFLLLPTVGLRATVWTGVGVNTAIFLLAAWLARRAPAAAPTLYSGAAAERRTRADWVLPLMLVSGACAFTYEVLWTRLLTHILGGSVYAFATMLASFLAGIALGAAAAAPLARSRQSAVISMAIAQTGIALMSLLAFILCDDLPSLASGLVAGGSAGLLNNVAVAAIILLPGALCMGATFPLAVRLLAGDGTEASRPSGRVYAWNTVGAIVGAIAAAFLLIRGLGFAGTVTTAAAANLLLGGVAFLLVAPARLVPAALLAVIATAVIIVPISEPEKLLRFNPLSGELHAGRLDYLGIGRSATVLTLAENERSRILTNGLPEGIVRPFDDRHRDLPSRWLTAIPTLARPNANNLLVVGMGAGRAIEGIPGQISKIDVVELEQKVIAANQRLAAQRWVDPLKDSRLKLYINDARGALILTGRRYDIIASQPSHPWTAGASHLYTREFYDLARQRLVADGVFVQWIGLNFVDPSLLRSVIATLRASFPYVQMYTVPRGTALLFLASGAPLDLERTAAQSLSASPQDYARVGLFAPEDAVAALELDADGATRFAADSPVSTDDRNLLQTRSPRILAKGRLRPEELHQALGDFDPLLRRVGDLNRLYLARRLIATGGIRRAEILARTAPTQVEKLTIEALLELARGNQGGVALLSAASKLAPDNQHVLVELARMRRTRVDAGNPEITSVLAGLGAAGQLMVRGWRLASNDDWQGLQALDTQLAQVNYTDPAFLEVNRLRAHWRIETRDQQHIEVARSLLEAAVAFNADAEDLVLRAELALETGWHGYALELVARSRRLLSRSSRPTLTIARANTVLNDISAAPEAEERLRNTKIFFRRLQRLKQPWPADS
jgi:spermidine synthase